MIWVLVLVAVVVGFLIWQFNRMVAMRRLTDNAWADVDVYLKRRAELVPNLVETVKGAAAFESSTFQEVAAARSQSLASSTFSPDRQAAESVISHGMTRAFALAESYPDLKAGANFLNLQHELSNNERLIADSRQYFNACVRDYNTMIESFPANLVANFGGFKAREFFEVDSTEDRIAPHVKGL